MNNLHGHAMSHYLPISNFKWVKNIDEIEQRLKVKVQLDMYLKQTQSTQKTYIMNIVIIHQQYKKIKIQKEWLSNYCLKISNEHNITTGTVKKLVPNLMNKNNYVIHYRNLQQCLELGMKLKKIHRILKFKQSDWMKPYTDFNTQKRTISNSESDKNFFKLMNNAVYGKTMENMRKRVKIRIIKNEKDIIKYTSKPKCVRWNIYDKKLVAIHKKKICLILNKPIYVGFTVLETSKWEM